MPWRRLPTMLVDVVMSGRAGNIPPQERCASLRDALQRLGEHEASNIVLVRGVRRLGFCPEETIAARVERPARVRCVVTYDVRKYVSHGKSRLGDMAFVVMASTEDAERLLAEKVVSMGETVLEISRFERRLRCRRPCSCQLWQRDTAKLSVGYVLGSSPMEDPHEVGVGEVGLGKTRVAEIPEAAKFVSAASNSVGCTASRRTPSSLWPSPAPDLFADPLAGLRARFPETPPFDSLCRPPDAERHARGRARVRSLSCFEPRLRCRPPCSCPSQLQRPNMA